jgi:NADH:ubiquinone oxidoreductase subunit C
MSDLDLSLRTANTLLAAWARATAAPEPNRLDVTIGVDDLLPAVKALCDARWGYLAAITGLDMGAEVGEIEALYQFCAGRAVVTLRVRLAYGAARVPSLSEIIPSVSFFERELAEMFGVTITGRTYPGHLYLPDNWPGGVYPLRKDYAPSEPAQA